MYRNIQLLRALAALMVFIFHAVDHYRAMHGTSPVFLSFSKFGYFGVDIFFVISGFVAAHTTLKLDRNTQSGIDFLRRRVLRIYLGYWPFWILYLIAATLFYRYSLQQVDLIKSFFLGSSDMTLLLVPVTWSLTYELIFYILISLSIKLPTKIAILLFHIVEFFLVIWIVLIFSQIHNSVESFFAMLSEFVGGILLYVHKEKLTQPVVTTFAFLIGLVSFSYGVTLGASNNSIRIMTFGISSWAIVLLFVYVERRNLFRANDFFVGMGDASYTLYLVHLLALSLFYFSNLRDYLSAQSYLIRELGFILFIIVTVWVSRLLYLIMERPLFRWGNSFFSRRYRE